MKTAGQIAKELRALMRSFADDLDHELTTAKLKTEEDRHDYEIAKPMAESLIKHLRAWKP